MKQFLIAFFALLMLCTPALAADSLESLQKQLQALEAELPEILKEETDLDTQHDYVKRVLALRETIEALEEEEQLSEGDERVLILKSVKLKYREKGSSDYQEDENYNTDGFASEGRKDKWVRTLKVEDYPEKILIGEGFAFSVIAARNGGAGKIGVRIDRRHSASSFGPSQINIQSEGSGESPPMTLNANFSFKEDTWKGGAQYGLYDLKVRADGTFKNANDHDHYPNAKELVLTKMMSANKTPSYKKAALVFKFFVPAKYNTKEEEKYLEFLYHYGNEDDKPADIASFQLPDMSEAQETAQDDSAASESDETAEKDGDKNGSQDESAAQAAAPEKERKQRKKHIKYWLKNAEPVENAQAGYDLKYDKWGRVKGKAPNGTITLSGKPDDAGTDSIHYVWAKAGTLDSHNLCTLKNYVERKLADRETASCQKDMPTPQDGDTVPDFVGMQAAKAKAMLDKQGVKVKWRAGTIAKNTTQQGLVEKQKPASGTDLKNVKQVELWTYRYAAKSVLVPDVTRMQYKDAIIKLKQEGLVPSIGKVQEPVMDLQVGTVLRQKTKPGTKVSHGATVVLDIFSGGSAQARMPDVIGMPYEKAAKEVQAAGLKPLKKLGPYASSPEQEDTVKESGMAAGRNVDFGTAVTMTVYNTYSEKTAPKKQPSSSNTNIAKRDPASAFGGKTAPEGSEAVNTDWAGMWRVDRTYDMELHVSGNKVTGRYGKNTDKTIEGTISGNILTGWWRDGKKYGRFKNTLNDDGNSWSGKWNMMKDKLGRWNGGWRAKRIGKKKPSAPVVKPDSADVFGGVKNPDPPIAQVPAPAQPKSVGAFKCDPGIPGAIVESSGPLYPDRRNGFVQTDKAEGKDYVCRYKAKGGKQHIAIISFFDKQPTTVDGKKWKDYMCDFHGIMGRGKIPVYINQQGGVSINDIVGRENVMRFYDFHIAQVKRHAISCR